jgi:hypothetical protein
MSLESFQSRHENGILQQQGGRIVFCRRIVFRIHLQPRAHPQEIQNRQAAGIASRPPGGQRVIGTGAIVAQHFRRLGANKEAAVVLALARHGLRVARLNFQMLRGQGVADPDTLRQTDRVDGKTVLQGGLGRGLIGFRQGGELLGQLGVDAVNEVGGGGDENGAGHDIVLRLGQQVGGDHGRIGRVIGQDQDFRRPRQHINAAVPLHQRLGRRDPLIARAANDIARRNLYLFLFLVVAIANIILVQAVGQGKDRLRPAHAQHHIHARHMGRRQGNGRRSWRGQHDRIASRGPGGAGRHEHRRGQRIAAPGGVATGRGAGRHGVSGPAAGDRHCQVGERFALGQRKGGDAVVYLCEGLAFAFFQTVKGGAAGGEGNAKGGGVGGEIAQARGDGKELGSDDATVGAAQFAANGLGLEQGGWIDGVFDFVPDLGGRSSLEHGWIQIAFQRRKRRRSAIGSHDVSNDLAKETWRVDGTRISHRWERRDCARVMKSDEK